MEAADINNIMSILNEKQAIDQNLIANIIKREPFKDIPNSASSTDAVLNDIGINKEIVEQMVHKINGIASKKKSCNKPLTQNIDQNTSNNIILNDKYSLFGYSMPSSTLYFTLVLIAIGALIYMTSGEKKKKLKDNEDEKNKSTA